MNAHSPLFNFLLGLSVGIMVGGIVVGGIVTLKVEKHAGTLAESYNENMLSMKVQVQAAEAMAELWTARTQQCEADLKKAAPHKPARRPQPPAPERSPQRAIWASVRLIAEENFTVERLTADEVNTLLYAGREFDAARLKHDAILAQIKANHGQSSSALWGCPCGSIVTTVELRGSYALITKTKDNGSCPIPAKLGFN